MKTCELCNKTVSSPRNKKRIFCSKECYYKSLKKIHKRNCVKCGKEFILKNIAYEKRGGGKYCSIECGKYATKKHEFNEHFFENINSEPKAYWLGFLFADGWNSKNEFGVELSYKDKDHLEALKNALEASQNVKYREKKSYGKKSKTACIQFNSIKTCEILNKIGCTPNKSKTVKYPSIPKHLNRHFIRGIFDGDGCFYMSNNNNITTFSIYSASNEFIFKIKKILENELDCKICFYANKNCGGSIKINKKQLLSNAYEYLYNRSTICLNRKKEIFENFLRKYSHKYGFTLNI